MKIVIEINVIPRPNIQMSTQELMQEADKHLDFIKREAEVNLLACYGEKIALVNIEGITVKKSDHETVDFTRINSDSNGSPRYVCNHHELLTKEEKESTPLSQRYALAIKKAKKIGGRKFHNKQYGGGIVFTSYSLPELEKDILELRNK